MQVLIYIAGYAGWPVLFSLLAGRLLAIRVSVARGALCGLAGVAVGAAMSAAVTGGAKGTAHLVAYVTFAIMGTLAALVLVDFLARPAAVGRLQGRFGSIPHPVTAARLRMARMRRYTSITWAIRRNGLVSALALRNRAQRADHAQAREQRFGTQLSQALEEAGGMFVKLGQVLSTRPDLVGEHAAVALSVLQDRVAPADQLAVDQVLRAELGRSPDEIFEWLAERPLAAASIGQVHRARLRDGPEVVVKIQRPGIEELVECDLDIILTLARRLDAAAVSRPVTAARLAEGFAENLRQELDYTLEARNTQLMGEILGPRAIRVPRVFAEFSSRRVLVLEFADATPLRDAAAILENLGGRRTELACQLLDAFLAQVLEAGIVDVDPHPGNVLVSADGALTLIDFGSVVRLHAGQRLALARVLMAIDRQDPSLLRDALLELAIPPQVRDLDALDRALAGFLAQRLGPGARPGAGMFTDLMMLLTGFGLTFDPPLAGVFRAALTLEGTLRVLDPEFAMLEEVKSLAGKVASRVFGQTALGRAVGEDLYLLAPMLRRIPARLDRITAAMERGELGYNVRLLAHDEDRRLLHRLFGRGIVALMSAAIGLVAALLLDVNNGIMVTKGVTLAQALGYAGLIVATVLGMRVLIAISRDRVI